MNWRSRENIFLQGDYYRKIDIISKWQQMKSCFFIMLSYGKDISVGTFGKLKCILLWLRNLTNENLEGLSLLVVKERKVVALGKVCPLKEYWGKVAVGILDGWS